MITGKRAFEGENSATVIAAILTADPPVFQGADIPPALARAVRRCLAKDPDDRWQTARDLHAELHWIEESLASKAAPTNLGAGFIPARSAWKFWTLAAAAIAGAWMLATHFSSSTQPVQVIRSSLLPPPGFSFAPYQFAISPDGANLAFVAIGPDGSSGLWMRSLSGSTAQPLNGTGQASYPFWSPDSRHIGFFADFKLKSVSIAGGGVQILSDVSTPRGGSWGSDGSIVFGATAGAMLERVSSAGGAAAAVTRLAGGSQAHRWPWFLPDGRHFLYFVDWSLPGDSHGNGIYAGTVGTEDVKPVFSNVSGNVAFVSGNLLYVSDRSLLAQPFDPRKLETTGPAVPIAAQELEEGPSRREGFSASENGSIVFQSAADSPARMIWFDARGKELSQLLQAGYRDPSLSPDGTRLAVTSDDAHNGKEFIRIIDLRTGIVTRFSDGGDERSPCWTRDGKLVTYRSGSDQTALIMQAPADSSAAPRKLLQGANVRPNDWSPDGHLAFMDYSRGQPRTKIYSAATGETVDFFTDEVETQYSPDGKWIAGVIDDVFVHAAQGSAGRIQISIAGGAQPRWSDDGKHLFYIQPDRKLMEVDFDAQNKSASAPRVVFQTHIVAFRGDFFQYDVAPDGRFLINSFPAGNSAPLTLLSGWTALLRKH